MKTYDNMQELSEQLTRCNIKPSFQRIKILQRLKSKKDHPTVNQIYNELIYQIPSLSKTTVYNTLNLFIKHGLARAVNTDTNESRYDIISEKHGHFLCNECATIYDFDIDANIDFSFLKQEGNEIQDMDITIRGVCNNCLKNKN